MSSVGCNTMGLCLALCFACAVADLPSTPRLVVAHPNTPRLDTSLSLPLQSIVNGASASVSLLLVGFDDLNLTWSGACSQQLGCSAQVSAFIGSVSFDVIRCSNETMVLRVTWSRVVTRVTAAGT